MVYFNYLNMAELLDEYLRYDTTTPTKKPTTPTKKPITSTREATTLAKKATTPTEQAAILTEYSMVPDRQLDGIGEDQKVLPASASNTQEVDTSDALEGPYTKYYVYNDAWTTENRIDYGVAQVYSVFNILTKRIDQLLVASIINYFRIILTSRKAVGCNFFTKNNFSDQTHTL